MKTSRYSSVLRACKHGGGRPQVGEVTRLGGVTHRRLSRIYEVEPINVKDKKNWFLL